MGSEAEMTTRTSTIKDEARALIESLPDDVNANELLQALYAQMVRHVIERGLADSAAGRLTDVEDFRRELGLPD